MLINKFFNKSEFIIVFVGSLINFVIKSSLVTLNYKFDILPFELFYLLTLYFYIPFSGYFTVKSVFKYKQDKNNFNRFLSYNILFKLGDYFMVIFYGFNI